MRLSDYNRLRQMLHLEPVSLQQDQYLIQTKKRLKKTLLPFSETPLHIQGQDYVCAGIYTDTFEQSGHNGADYILVVPDETAASMTPYYSLMAASIKGSLPDDFYDQVLSMWGINMKNNSYEELDNYMDLSLIHISMVEITSPFSVPGFTLAFSMAVRAAGTFRLVRLPVTKAR